MEKAKSSCVHCNCTDHDHQVTTSLGKWARVRPEELVFAISYMTAMSLWQLPTEYIDGNPVPTVIFNGQPTTFHCFVLGLIVSFTGAVSAIQLRDRKPKVATYYKLLVVSPMAVIVAILNWAAVPAGFRWVVLYVRKRHGGVLEGAWEAGTL